MKKILIPLLLVFVMATLPVSAQQTGSFCWTLGLENVISGDLVPFSVPVQCRTGEKFRLAINPSADCYCYVVYESPDGNDVMVLYAGVLKMGQVWHSPDLEISLPQGSESLFIVASKNEQKTLAQKVKAFTGNSGQTQRRALMNEIFKVRSDTSKFKELPEKPVLMGGASRGDPEKSQGVEYSGLATYVKTISIEH